MLTRKQLNSLFINAFAAKMLLTFPHNIIEVCKNAAWISSIYILLLALLLFGLTAIIYSSDKNVIQLAEKYGGAPLRIITGGFVFAVLFMNFFPVIRIFSEAIRLVLLQTSHTEFIGLLLAVCIVLGAYCGIEAIARLQQLFLPVAGLVFAVFIIFLIPTINPDNIFPLLGGGAGSLFIENIPFLSVFSDLLILNLLLPLMEERGDYRRSGIWVIVMGGVIVVMIITAYCFSYTYPVTEGYLMPVYQLERLIKLGSFFSRLEAVFQFIWSVSILLYCSFYLYMMAETWKTAFALRAAPPLIPVIAIMMIGVSLIPDSLSVMVGWESAINRWVYIPAFSLPIIFGLYDKMFHVKHFLSGRYNGGSIIMNIIRLLPAAALVMLLTSCEEPDNMAYITALGINKSDEGYYYTIQFAQPTQISGGASEKGGSGGNIVKNMTVEAPTLYSAINVADTIISKDLSLSHAKLFVVSEDVAREGLSPLNDVIIRNNDIRSDIYISVAPDAEEFLEEVKPSLELNPVKYYQLTYENKNGSAIPQNTALDFYSACVSGSKDCILPLAGVAETEEANGDEKGTKSTENFSQQEAEVNKGGFEKETRNYYAGQTGKKLYNKSEVLGSAVFKGDKYIGQLGSTETELHNILMDHFTVMNINFCSDTEPEAPITMRIEEKTPPRYEIDRESRHVDVYIGLQGELLSAPSSHPRTHNEGETDREMSEMVSTAAERLIHKAYNEMNADILGIRGRLKRQFMEINSYETYCRNFEPREWSFTVHTELTTKRTGMTYFYE